MAKRAQKIEAMVTKDNSRINLTVVALPLRDRNPAKNDGQLPDLGEAVTLLRFWTIARAIQLGEETIIKLDHVTGIQRIPVSFIVVRDSRRYPSFWTDPEEDIVKYQIGIEAIAKALSIEDLVKISSPEQMQEGLRSADIEKFRGRYEGIYIEKLKTFQGQFDPYRESIMGQVDRASFLGLLQTFDHLGKIAPSAQAKCTSFCWCR